MTASNPTPGESRSLTEAREMAQKALFDKISMALSAFDTNVEVLNASGVVRNLALAYRLTAGGPQPGVVEK